MPGTTIPTNEPKTVRAGDTWHWTTTLADYPAGTWTLIYYYSLARERFEITATASGVAHAVLQTAANTADRVPGTYDYIARVNDGTSFFVYKTGRLTVLPNLGIGGDHRSHNQTVRDNLLAVIENRATSDQLNYSVQGRSVGRMSWDELLGAYDRYAALVAKEMGIDVGRVFIRFGAP